MADYKRMVSYMYQYENGVKKKNVGYARVEVKSGQCKITLHMQLLGQLDSIFPTYLIQRDEKNLELIYLGDTILKSQVMDSKLAADEDNIMGSGYGFSDMGGLLIFLNDSVFFATEWDDKPIIVKEVLEAMKPKPKKPIVVEEAGSNALELRSEEAQAISKEEVQEASSIEAGEQQEASSIEAGEQQEASSIEAVEQQEASSIEAGEQQEAPKEDETMIPKYKLPRGWKTIERLQKPYVAEIKNVDNLVEVADMQTGEMANSGENIELSINEDKNYNKGNDDDERKDDTDGIGVAEAKDNGESSTNVDGNDIISKGNMDIETEEDLPDHPTALRFFENYPRIYPFEDNEITLCVKIEPKDIGLLPKDIWVLSNNSFLMHGYYCYHHLIFAKMKDRFGCRYILGIPGIYHNREKFMARMFGFESFKSIRKRELRQGDFGYWYLPISF